MPDPTTDRWTPLDEAARRSLKTRGDEWWAATVWEETAHPQVVLDLIRDAREVERLRALVEEARDRIWALVEAGRGFPNASTADVLLLERMNEAIAPREDGAS